MNSKTLVIYGTDGGIIMSQSGVPEPQTPMSDSFLYTEIPEGKYLIGVDISVLPHKPIFEDLPKSEIDLIKEQLAKRNWMTATEQLESTDIESVTLSEFIVLKIASLKEQCTQAIYDGFQSKTVDKGFGFNELDQVNFTQQMLLIVAAGGQINRSIDWKTLDGGIIKMTVEQFLGVVKEAEAHKRKEQEKYWVLEMRLKNSITKEEALAVTW